MAFSRFCPMTRLGTCSLSPVVIVVGLAVDDVGSGKSRVKVVKAGA